MNIRVLFFLCIVIYVSHSSTTKQTWPIFAAMKPINMKSLQRASEEVISATINLQYSTKSMCVWLKAFLSLMYCPYPPISQAYLKWWLEWTPRSNHSHILFVVILCIPEHIYLSCIVATIVYLRGTSQCFYLSGWDQHNTTQTRSKSA